ncbi:MAG: 3-dehydroquinate synthase [Candidatus Limnocylindrales bacterium]
MDLVLVGLPGSGKSAVGRRLAQRHGATFIDLDDLIERRVGRPVPAIFADEGEAAFRRHEREAVLSLGPADPDAPLRRVIATGGGTVIDPRNRWQLYRGRFPVWLDGSAEVLGHRLGRSANIRPLMAGRDPVAAIRELAAARERFYAPALQISATAPIGAIVGAVEQRMADGPTDSVTLLRADTAIGRVEIGHGIAAAAIAGALRRGHARRAILLAEPRTWEVAGAGIADALAADGWPVARVLLPRGENAKRLRVVEQSCRELARLHVDRRETLVAIGGGALTDAAGFVAASYLRGVPIVQVPTTLVGQIDAALGGKTAVDLPEGKNLVGAFHQPVAFVADVSLLATLPSRQLRAALGEGVKMGVLGDERLLELIEQDGEAIARGDRRPFESGSMAELVERCAWAKVEVVTADERESGLRMTLNLGHTIGHGIEAAAGYSKILHGEAVAYGLRGAFAIARALEIAPPERAGRVTALLDRLGLGVAPPAVDPESVREHMATDKKHALGRLNWVLPTATGVVVRSDVPAEAVAAGLAAALRLAPVTPTAEVSVRP